MGLELGFRIEVGVGVGDGVVVRVGVYLDSPRRSPRRKATLPNAKLVSRNAAAAR